MKKADLKSKMQSSVKESTAALGEEAMNAKIRKMVVVVDELKELLPPLTTDERSMLKNRIIKEGFKEPVDIWKKSDEEYILIDGHNRREICNELGITWTFKINNEFKSIEEVKDWMREKNFARRSINEFQKSIWRGEEYNSKVSRRGGKTNEQENISSLLAEKYAINERTIRRDAELVSTIKTLESVFKDKKYLLPLLKSHENPFSKRDIIYLADLNSKGLISQPLKDAEAAIEIISSLKEPTKTKKDEKATSEKGRGEVPDYSNTISNINLQLKEFSLDNIKEPLKALKKLIKDLEAIAKSQTK